MHRHVVAAITTGLSLVTAALATTRAATQPLVRYEVRAGGIPASLTGRPGDPQKGREAAIDRQLGNCLACHQISALKSEPYHGNVGPSLDGVASRLTAAQIRLHIVDATKLNPDTIMPPFYRIDGLNKVMHQFEGKPILTAQQVEDVVAFLETLK